jgi:hypothetical protein
MPTQDRMPLIRRLHRLSPKPIPTQNVNDVGTEEIVKGHPLSPELPIAHDHKAGATSVGRDDAPPKPLLPLALNTMDGRLTLGLGGATRNHFLVASVWSAMATLELLAASARTRLIAAWHSAHGVSVALTEMST